MIIPPIEREVLDTLGPDNCFIAIAKTVGSQFQEFEGFRKGVGDSYFRLRNLTTALFRHGRVRDHQLVLFKEPFLREGQATGYVLARFWLDCYWEAEDAEVQFYCLLVTGSPQNNLPYTAILQKVMIQRMMQEIP